MINKIITSEGNVQFIYGDSGKIINVHPFHVYTVFNVDTVSFLLIAMPKDSGLAIFTTKAEDLEVNGETYTFEELPNALSEAFAIAGAQARAEIVDELPETGMTNTIYLVPKEDGHGYDEYIYIKETGTWELIGDTDIELSRYVKKTDFNAYTAQTAAKIDYLSGATDAEVARATSAETALDEKIDGKVIELTQAEYDALEEVDPKVIYVITDAVPVNMADYVKKVDFNSYSAATKTAMDNETSDRTSADTAEQTAREAADSFISGAVDTLSTALANEVQRAQNAESGLSEDIEDEMTRAMVIEDALQDAIDAVSGNVETETARAEGAESDLDDKIDAVSGATSAALALKQNILTAGTGIDITSDVISVTGSTGGITSGEVQTMIDESISGKADTSSLATVATSGSYDDLTNKPTIPTVPTSNTAFTNDAQYATSGYVDSAVSGKANSSDVYLKNETSGATEITTALNGKADKTTAARGLGYGDQTTHSVMHLTNQNDQQITGYYYTLSLSKINGKTIVKQGSGNPNTFSLVETSAITTSVTSASTDSQIPSAKAVYDAIQEGGGSIEVSSAITENDTNPVEGGALYDELRIVDNISQRTQLIWADGSNGVYCFNLPSNCYKIEFVGGNENAEVNIVVNANEGLTAVWSGNTWTVSNISQGLTTIIDGSKLTLISTVAFDTIESVYYSWSYQTTSYAIVETSSVTPLIDKVKEDEQVTAAALNELNARITALEAIIQNMNN